MLQQLHFIYGTFDSKTLLNKTDSIVKKSCFSHGISKHIF